MNDNVIPVDFDRDHATAHLCRLIGLLADYIEAAEADGLEDSAIVQTVFRALRDAWQCIHPPETPAEDAAADRIFATSLDHFARVSLDAFVVRHGCAFNENMPF